MHCGRGASDGGDAAQGSAFRPGDDGADGHDASWDGDERRAQYDRGLPFCLRVWNQLRDRPCGDGAARSLSRTKLDAADRGRPVADAPPTGVQSFNALLGSLRKQLCLGDAHPVDLTRMRAIK